MSGFRCGNRLQNIRATIGRLKAELAVARIVMKAAQRSVVRVLDANFAASRSSDR
jgi:hypothetical protein